jgi:hypothetical protein
MQQDCQHDQQQRSSSSKAGCICVVGPWRRSGVDRQVFLSWSVGVVAFSCKLAWLGQAWLLHLRFTLIIIMAGRV